MRGSIVMDYGNLESVSGCQRGQYREPKPENGNIERSPPYGCIERTRTNERTNERTNKKLRFFRNIGPGDTFSRLGPSKGICRISGTLYILL